MQPTRVTHLLELLRWVGAGTGIFLAFLSPNDASRQLDLLCIWVVVPIAGLTGIESIFFGKAAAEQSGYEQGSAYQRQSGLSNLSLALTTIGVYLLGWNLQAKASLLIALLLFLFFSAINHTYSAIQEHNTSTKNFLRPIMTLVLLAVVIPFILRASPNLHVRAHHLSRSSSHICVDGVGVLPTSKTAKPIHEPLTRDFALSDAP